MKKYEIVKNISPNIFRGYDIRGVYGKDLNEDKKSAMISCEPSDIKKMYNIDKGSTYLNINITGFSGEILDILLDSIGHHSVGGEVILFLMSDGTVEYVPLEKALKNGGNNIKSYGKVQGVSDIVRLSTVRIGNITNDGEKIGAHSNPVAIKADGSFYDVGKILHDIVWE